MTQTPPEQDKLPLDGPHRQFEDTLLENLTGEWQLSRKMGKRLEENHVKAEWILNHQFLQLHMKDVKSPPSYEALVLIGYDHENSRYVVYWLDNFGGKFSEKGAGTREGNSIQFVFQYPDGLLQNTFTWNAESKTWLSRIEQQDERANGQSLPKTICSVHSSPSSVHRSRPNSACSLQAACHTRAARKVVRRFATDACYKAVPHQR
jgi:hypothetical protein